MIGAISSIVSLIEFSQKVLARAAELGANRNDVGEAFLSINALLPPINRAVKRTKERIKSGEIDDETCTSLIPIHRDIERTLKELEAILKKFAPKEGASKLEVFWKAGRSVFQEKKGKGILQRLHEYVGVLTLSHAEAADAGNLSLAEKGNIQQILTNISHSKTAREAQKYYDVPRRLVRNFIGREEILSQIDNYFLTTDIPCPKAMILHALGGQGKSQIALKYCEKSRESHQAIFWINASSETTTREALERIATVLDGTSPSGLEGADQKIQHLLKALETSERWEARWILVFDNYDSPEVFNVNDFFPRSTSPSPHQEHFIWCIAN